MTKEEIRDYSLKISQSSKSQLVVLTYEIIINYLESAQKAFEQGQTEDFQFNIKKAKQFVDNLLSSLDVKYKLALELMSIYLFVNKSLQEVVSKNNIEKLNAVIGIIEKLKLGFYEISKEDKSGPSFKNAPKVYAGLTYGKGKLNEYTTR